MQGPRPETEREYIIQIYDGMNTIIADIKEIREQDLAQLCGQVKVQNGRLAAVERWQERANGGVRLTVIVGSILSSLAIVLGILKAMS